MTSKVTVSNPDDQVTPLRVKIPNSVGPVSSVKAAVPQGIKVLVLMPGKAPVGKVRYVIDH